MKETIIGTITKTPEYSHTIGTIEYLRTEISSARISGVIDTIPLIIPATIELKQNQRIKATGEFRSYNTPERHLFLYMYSEDIEPTTDEDDNIIEYEGYICKTPIYRTTPGGRQITDLMIAVNRLYNKSDYIPTVLWGRNAQNAATLPIGARVLIKGRVQSRKYGAEATAYEVSASSLTNLSE